MRHAYDLEAVIDVCNAAALVRQDVDPSALSAAERRFVEGCWRLLQEIVRSGRTPDDYDDYDHDSGPDRPAVLAPEILEKVADLTLYPAWTRRLPDEFFANVLRVWEWSAEDLRDDDRARQFAAVVDDMVYRRLPP
ncbi:hypothetical protein, partial [Alienimonas sp. DA493]|uniref:hypothetical protein n=1 Tax=Alienimonas sp. DA493 TaxID=3373605 RepID=UPI003754FDE2